MSVSAGRPEVPSASGLISRSHLGIEPFELRTPTSLTDAAAAVADGSWAHGGGIDIAQRLRAGEAVDDLVPLCSPPFSTGVGLERLAEISVDDQSLFIGAGVSHARICGDPLVQSHRPDLAAAWRTIGNVRIRAAGTLGGNLAALNPGYDAAPLLAAAGAELVIAEPDGTERRCAVVDLPQDRLIVGCEVPLSGTVVFDRSLKPVVSVAVGDEAVAVGCAYDKVWVIPHGADQPEELARTIAELPEPTDDAFASAQYRRRMIGLLTDRALRAHAEQAASAGHRSSAASNSSAAHDSVPTPQGENASRRNTPEPDASRHSGTSNTSRASNDIHIEMHLNGEPFAAAAPPSEMLVDTIGSRAGLGGTRVGCDQAVCGACTVLVDGTPAASCSTFSWQAAGRQVLTIEAANASTGQDAHRTTDHNAFQDALSILPVVQAAFAAHSAFQCGYCTPGLILVASALLARHADPDRATICDWLDSNVCRCTGYLMVIEAVEAAAAEVRQLRAGDPKVAT